ncbi:MAG: glycerol-3-phosphate acyltransferase, partial [Anaerolineales bacterium]|nr:glycerol-3-phosphate acyltransferase [Anaerolineales bacterium]
MTVVIWALIGFFSGALPFSVWVGQFAMGTDIRQYGDGNPG